MTEKKMTTEEFIQEMAEDIRLLDSGEGVAGLAVFMDKKTGNAVSVIKKVEANEAFMLACVMSEAVVGVFRSFKPKNTIEVERYEN